MRRVLRSYASYYNETRTHRSLNKDAPIPRPVQRIGRIASNALVVGCTTNTSESEFSVHTGGPAPEPSVSLPEKML